jgi:hypothetical protein
MTTVFCKDCRNFLSPDQKSEWVYPRCKATETLNLVSGEFVYGYCDSERLGGSCGKDGKNWEPNMDLESGIYTAGVNSDE